MVDCVFCKIAGKQTESSIVHEDDRCVAFKDLNPQAPHHYLIVPKMHLANLATLRPEHETLMGHLCAAAAGVARRMGFEAAGYRVVVNVGSHGGESVNHLHLHLLGGRPLTWPPG